MTGTATAPSFDSAKSHQAFRKKFSLPFPLLCDEDKALAKAYGVYKQKSMYGRSYMGIERSDDLVILQITVSNTRTVEQKKALFARIAERLSHDPGLRQEDVFINLVEVKKENWSFGRGVAQYA